MDTVEQFEGLTNIMLSRPLMFIVATSCPARFDTLGPVNSKQILLNNYTMVVQKVMHLISYHIRLIL